MEQWSSGEPKIIIDEGTDENVERRIHFFDKLAHQKPAELQHALFTLGDAATSQTLDLSELSDRKTSLKRSPNDVMVELFTQRYDNDFDYDDDTRAALNKDETYGKLIQERDQADASRQSMDTKNLNRTELANYRAEQKRDAIRRYRVAFFLRRMIAYNESVKVPPEDQPELRSVS